MEENFANNFDCNTEVHSEPLLGVVISKPGIPIPKGRKRDLQEIKEENEIVSLLPPSFDELANEVTFPKIPQTLAKDWNNYFTQVGDWLVSNR